jgi:hypothetical protein
VKAGSRADLPSGEIVLVKSVFWESTQIFTPPVFPEAFPSDSSLTAKIRFTEHYFVK